MFLQLSHDGIKYLRRIEKLHSKLACGKLDIWFLTSCQDLGIVPKFLALRLSNVNACYARNFCRTQCRILGNACNDMEKKCVGLEQLYNEELASFKSKLSFTARIQLTSFLHHSKLRTKGKKKATLEKNLQTFAKRRVSIFLVVM